LGTRGSFPGSEVKHSPPSSAEVKNVGSYTFAAPQYAFMALCLVKKAHGQHYLYFLLFMLQILVEVLILDEF